MTDASETLRVLHGSPKVSRDSLDPGSEFPEKRVFRAMDPRTKYRLEEGVSDSRRNPSIPSSEALSEEGHMSPPDIMVEPPDLAIVRSPKVDKIQIQELGTQVEGHFSLTVQKDLSSAGTIIMKPF